MKTEKARTAGAWMAVSAAGAALSTLAEGPWSWIMGCTALSAMAALVLYLNWRKD